ncbi:3-keto-disaccharide hydrolase, partial [Singulisphaera rosea]
LCVAGLLGPGGQLLFGADQPASASVTPPSTPKVETFEPLFNGRNLDGWYTFLQKHGKDSDPDHVISIEDGAIHLYKHAEEKSMVVMGYIATQKEYGNYHVRFQYRWGEKKFEPRYALKRDAGFYYHILGPDLVWPRSLQFQVQQTDVGDLITLFDIYADTWIDSKTKDDEIPTFQPPESGGHPRVLGQRGIAYQKRLPGPLEVDGWNTVEVIARGDSTVHLLNGHVVNRADKIRLVDSTKPGTTVPVTRGRIALEIEAAEIYFRNVEIRSLDETPAAKP